MQIVIDIPEDLYKATVYGLRVNEIWDLKQAVANGKPLSKGHGRILDEKDILDIENNDGGWYDLVDMPEYIAGIKPIIEAYKAESEDKE